MDFKPFSHLSKRRKPRAKAIPTSRRVHEHTLEDPYDWLRAPDWQKVIAAPETLPQDIRAYLEAENRYCAAGFKPLHPLIRSLTREMRARIKEDDVAPPMKDGPYLYFERYRKGAQYPQICRKAIGKSRVEVMLDGVIAAEGKPFFSLGVAAHAPDHRLIAWSADFTGSESYVITIRTLATKANKTFEDQETLERTSGEVVWGQDSRFFYYVELDGQQRPWRVMRHRLGTSQSEDHEIYREEGTGWFVGIEATQDSLFMGINVHNHDTSEVHLVDLTKPDAASFCIAPRVNGVEYDVEHHDSQLIIRTNHAKAEDFKIIALPYPLIGSEKARFEGADVLVPETPGRIILSHAVLKEWLIWASMGEEGPRAHIRRFSSGEEEVFAPRAAIGTLDIETGYEYDTHTLRFSYESPNMPEVVLERDLATGQETVLKEQIVPSGHDASRYHVARHYAQAADGARIPVTILRLVATPQDGTAPALLYGYGAYGHAIEAGFRTRALSLVDRGFVFAIAHVRGGMDKGYGWYRAGKLESKVNTFTDFIAVADFLVEEGHAAPQRIVAQGGSAGGMLMGAVANIAGEKFAGIIAEVPFVDCLNTILDASLPLTPPEWVEWGNPITDEAVFSAMRAYSPYENISAKPYPPLLVIGGLTDPRVTYWEPAKYVAKLRATPTARDGVILFHTEMEAGHGGASGRFDSLRETARNYAFALHVTGLA